MGVQGGGGGTQVVWTCFGLCSDKAWLDAAALGLTLVALTLLARALRRARAAQGRGDPGRVMGIGGLGVVAGLAFLAYSFKRLCVTNAMGVVLGCSLEVMGMVLLQAVALLAMGIWVASVGRDLRETRGPAPLGPRRT